MRDEREEGLKEEGTGKRRRHMCCEHRGKKCLRDGEDQRGEGGKMERTGVQIRTKYSELNVSKCHSEACDFVMLTKNE